MPTVRIDFDFSEFGQVTAFIADMGRRLARADLVPILKTHFAPMVAMEKSILSGHNKSGALEASLKARTGGGDRPGTISVFSAPTATKRIVKKAWSRGRAQQRRWAAGIEPGRGRVSVFYGPFVEKGHRIVRRNASGQLYDTRKRTRPVHFAKGAVEALGDQQAELAAQAVINHIVG